MQDSVRQKWGTFQGYDSVDVNLKAFKDGTHVQSYDRVFIVADTIFCLKGVSSRADEALRNIEVLSSTFKILHEPVPAPVMSDEGRRTLARELGLTSMPSK